MASLPPPAPRVKALLLAGGLGTRLRPLTETTPKCLVPIAGRPLLDYWFERFEVAGVRDILINTHHLPAQVRAYIDRRNQGGRFRVVEAHEPELLGSAGTIRRNASWLDDADECLIVYADNLSNLDVRALLRFHRSHDDPVTMVLFRTPRPESCGIATLDPQARIVSFVEKPAQPTSNLANAGVYVIDAAVYREIAALEATDIGFHVLPRLVGRMRGWEWGGYHRDIGTLEAYEQAQREGPLSFLGYRRDAIRGPAAVFLDRDGTIIEHVHHLVDPEDVRLLPGAAEALVGLRQAGYACVVATNQSVVGRRMVSEAGLEEIHRRLRDLLAAAGAELDAIYFCPHVPRGQDETLVEHRDRKPGPGMLLQAAADLDLDPGRSWMVGDALSDVLAGEAAGCRGTILLRAAEGFAAWSPRSGPPARCQAPDLTSAARLILASGGVLR